MREHCEGINKRQSNPGQLYTLKRDEMRLLLQAVKYIYFVNGEIHLLLQVIKVHLRPQMI